MTGDVPKSPLNRQARENLREPGSAATVHTLMGPSFRGYERSGTMKNEARSNGQTMVSPMKQVRSNQRNGGTDHSLQLYASG